MKHTYIQIKAGSVIVRTNANTSTNEIRTLISKKSGWIKRHLKTFQEKEARKKLSEGGTVYFLGHSYRVVLVDSTAQEKPGVRLTDTRCIITADKNSTEEMLAKSMDLFYKEHAIKAITPLVQQWSQTMRLTPSKIGYRRAKTRWGSCSVQNNLSFNIYLAKLPKAVIEYVVVHELAHIRHKNHSSEFWKTIEKHLPEYKSRRETLRAFEKLF